MEDSANECFVSQATAWEIAIKLGLGKLKLNVEFDELFPGILVANGFTSLIANFRHFRATIALPFHHRDPFDRILIAQAIVEKMTLVSCDPNMARYGAPMLW